MDINQLLARAAKLLLNYTWENSDYSGTITWPIYAEMFGIKDIADNTHRLYRSQTFGDPDYPDCLISFFKNIAREKSEELAKDFVRYVLKEELDLNNEEVIKDDPELIVELGIEKEINLPEIDYIYGKNILNVNNLPDDFYIDLQNQINKAFSYEIYSAVRILARKLLENLLIDILRKKYGMNDIEIFYNTEQNRFLNFSSLINNLEANISDFRPIEPTIDKEFINKIDKFRKKGNSSAHSITLHIKKEELKNELEELEYIVKVLVRVYNNL